MPERIVAFSLLGSPDLDLRQAVIASEEVRILSIAVIGSLTAIVPAGIDVELRGLSLIGGNDLFDRGAPDLPGGPVLKIRCFSLVGGAGIRRVRAVRKELSP